MSISEVLTAANRVIRMERTRFAVPAVDSFTTSEGLIGHSEPGGPVIRFAADMCLAELVDDDNNPVPPGMTSAKVLLTNLHNFSQPLIRYELTDRFTRPHATPADGWPWAGIEGRADDIFRYGGVAVHPHVIRSALAGDGAVHEYQVRQTKGGADVACVTGGRLDTAVLAARLVDSLRQAGPTRPRSVFTVAEAIPREPRNRQG